MDSQELADAFRNREFVTGVIVNFFSPLVVEMLGEYGVDFVIVDVEHSEASLETVQTLVLASRAAGVAPVIRLPGRIRDDPDFARRSLDLGAAGVIFPRVESRDEVEFGVDAIKYYPDGNRGICTLTRDTRFTFGSDPSDFRRLNRDTSTLGLIEREEAVENIDEILGSGLLDAVMLGPGDYAQSIGHPGELQHPDVVAGLERVLGAADDYSVPVGAYALSRDDASGWVERGADFVFYSDIRIFRSGMEDNILLG